MSNIPRYLKINGHDSLLRDTYSMGVVNTNRLAYNASIRAHNEAMKKFAEHQRESVELNTLRKEVHELKELLLRLQPKEVQ